MKLTTLVLALALASPSGVTRATAAPAAQTPEPPRAGSSSIAEAQVRFRRGVALYEEGDYAAAEVEFARAYDLAPNFRILFNLGQIAYQRRDYVNALQYFRRYLSEGASRAPANRRLSVEAELAKLEERVGRLEISVDADGAQIEVDDLPVGTSPLLAAVEVNVGRRKVEILAEGLDPLVRYVDVAGKETVQIRFSARAARPEPAQIAPPRRAATAPSLGLTATPVAGRTGGASYATTASWIITAGAAAGAAVAGVIAWRTSTDLRGMRERYPTTSDELASARSRTRTASLVADGLAVGTAVMAVVSLALTFRAEKPAKSRVSIEPGGLGVRF